MKNNILLNIVVILLLGGAGVYWLNYFGQNTSGSNAPTPITKNFKEIDSITKNFKEIDSIIIQYQFDQPDTELTKSLDYLKKLDDNTQYQEKKKVLIGLLEKYIEIRRNVYVWQHPNTNKLEIRKKSLKYIHDIIKLDKSITPAQLAFLKSIG